jgi:hypothetical protein
VLRTKGDVSVLLGGEDVEAHVAERAGELANRYPGAFAAVSLRSRDSRPKVGPGAYSTLFGRVVP